MSADMLESKLLEDLRLWGNGIGSVGSQLSGYNRVSSEDADSIIENIDSARSFVATGYDLLSRLYWLAETQSKAERVHTFSSTALLAREIAALEVRLNTLEFAASRFRDQSFGSGM